MPQRYEFFNEILFDSYCKTCIDNAILKEKERKAAHLQIETPFSSFPDGFLSTLTLPELEPDDEADYCLVTMGDRRIRVKGQILGQALLSLLPKDREIVMRYYSLGERDERIAGAVGLSRSSVQRRRTVAIKKLREILESRL